MCHVAFMMIIHKHACPIVLLSVRVHDVTRHTRVILINQWAYRNIQQSSSVRLTESRSSRSRGFRIRSGGTDQMLIRARENIGTTSGMQVNTAESSHYPLPQRSSRRRTILQLTAVNGRCGEPYRLRGQIQICQMRQGQSGVAETEQSRVKDSTISSKRLTTTDCAALGNRAARGQLPDQRHGRLVASTPRPILGSSRR